MIIQKVVKGIGGITPAEAQEILEEGILCNWLRGIKNQPFPYKEISLRLTDRNLHWHQNEYDTPDPLRNNNPFKQETPYISTTAGTVERKNAIANNIFHPAIKTALEFATDTWRTDGYIFYCYVFVANKKATGIRMFGEELRELNIYHGYSPWQTEGEITAKIIIPSEQIEKAEFFDIANVQNQLAQSSPVFKPINPPIINNNYIPPTNFHNIRELL